MVMVMVMVTVIMVVMMIATLVVVRTGMVMVTHLARCPA